MAPADARDLDDTVARPPRRPAVRPAVLPEDFDDTITVVRNGAPRTPSRAPEPPVVTPPIALVEPLPSASGTPYVQPLTPEFTGNIWAEPLPEAPRPFRLKLADGTLVPLDQPVYLGRRPSVPRIHPGGVPLLVTLDSPEREVSSTHLELSTVGGAIVASDMRSTNGSVLRIPGSAPRTLLGGESAVVTPGTVIELGDGNLVELLAPDQDAAAPVPAGARS
ncbi:MAG TPA: FHA domain-containing protein [Pseudolysinimonas sp.]